MNVDLIHKSGRDNVVLDALSKREELHAISTTQALRLIYKDKINLQWKIREGYFKDPKAQRLLGELHKGMALKEVKLVDGLLKYKQSQVYVPQDKLRLLVLKEENNSPVSIKEVLLVVHKGGDSPLVKTCVKCQMNPASYQKQDGHLQP